MVCGNSDVNSAPEVLQIATFPWIELILAHTKETIAGGGSYSEAVWVYNKKKNIISPLDVVNWVNSRLSYLTGIIQIIYVFDFSTVNNP